MTHPPPLLVRRIRSVLIIAVAVCLQMARLPPPLTISIPMNVPWRPGVIRCSRRRRRHVCTCISLERPFHARKGRPGYIGSSGISELTAHSPVLSPEVDVGYRISISGLAYCRSG